MRRFTARCSSRSSLRRTWASTPRGSSSTIFKEDGECPSVLLAASAMAARTSKIKIGTAMLLLPLHRPVRVAEDVAVLDNIANGRVIVGVAAGYRPIEFEGLEEARKGREARMEEQLEILINAWTRDSFAHNGRHYQFPEISVMPKPAQKPHPPIWIGASTEGGFRRAAKWAEALCSSPRHHLSDLKNHYASYRRYLRVRAQGNLHPGHPRGFLRREHEAGGG